MRTTRIVIDWMAVIVWMCMIFAGSTDIMSADNTSRFILPVLLWFDPHVSLQTLALAQLIVRKMAHVTEYAILATLLWRAVRHHWAPVRKSFWKPAFLTLAVAMIYATTDEFHQSFIPSRTATAHDVMIDVTGAIVGLVICWMFVRNRSTAVPSAI